jgi:hypothetical protein
MEIYYVREYTQMCNIIEIANTKLTLQYLTEAHPTNAHENTNNKYVMENTL